MRCSTVRAVRAQVREKRRDKGRWGQVRSARGTAREKRRTRDGVREWARRAWDSAGNACAAYAGEWGASLAAGTPELAPMRRVDTLPPCLDFIGMR